MDLGLTGKRALVTGSNSGIGAAIATMLAAEGCAVIVHGRNSARTMAIAHEIGAAGIALGDLATDAGADAVVDAAGNIDILVNNAGGAAGTSAMAWTTVDEHSWVETYQMNTVAAARMIRRLLPGMQARGWGRIINIVSAAASQPLAFGRRLWCGEGRHVEHDGQPGQVARRVRCHRQQRFARRGHDASSAPMAREPP